MKSLRDVLNESLNWTEGERSEKGTRDSSTSDNKPTTCRLCGSKDVFCNQTGFYDLDVPVGHPDFNKVFRCPNNPVEHDGDRKEKLRQISNLSALSEKRFDNFHTVYEGLDESEIRLLKSALHVALEFADDPRGWLLFVGSYGSGKTHLAAAIGNARLEQGDLVIFVTAPDLLDHLRSAYAPSADVPYGELFERLKEARLLILDDLGVENPSAWAQEKLFQLLNHRYTRKLPTVITTNADLRKLDPRIQSRMLDTDQARVAKMKVRDYRTGHESPLIGTKDLVSQWRSYYADYHLNTFDIDTNVTPVEKSELIKAVTKADQYIKRITLGHWLLIRGATGTGKTHLAAAIANHASEYGQIDVVLITVADLLDTLRSAYSPDSEVTFDEQFTSIRDCPLLVLDDLGSMSNAKAWAREKLIQIINHRYVTKRATVITTGEDYAEIDERIITRLGDRRICDEIYFKNVRRFVVRMSAYWR